MYEHYKKKISTKSTITFKIGDGIEAEKIDISTGITNNYEKLQFPIEWNDKETTQQRIHKKVTTLRIS